MTHLNHENNEILDVVNEQDEIIDAKPRNEVHQRGLLHREIQVWMFDENKNLFFQKMGLHKKSAGLLDATVAGHVSKGEEYLDAAVRETREETGIHAAPVDLIFLKKFKVTNTKNNSFQGESINNFIRSMYIYKKPITDKMIKKEIGIPDGGFQKLSYESLLKPSKEYKSKIKDFVLKKEIPIVLKYLGTL